MMFASIRSISVMPLLMGAVALGMPSLPSQSQDQFEAVAPRRHVESDLNGHMLPWGVPGTQIGDETINPVDRMEFVWVPAGSFVLGTSDTDSEGKLNSAHPFKGIHLNGFWLGKYPVTWGQYSLFCKKEGMAQPKDPGYPHTPLHPVVNITWQQAQAYAQWAHVGLPTEFQWEHASRGPKNYNYPWGNAWDPYKCVNSVVARRTGTTIVGKALAARSGFGCYDMEGNVSQWCANWYSKDYTDLTMNNPSGPETGTERGLRGAGWGAINPVTFRSSFRFHLNPEYRLDICGFRCVVSF